MERVSTKPQEKMLKFLRAFSIELAAPNVNPITTGSQKIRTLLAVSCGCRTSKEVAWVADMSPSHASSYLSMLSAYGLVKRIGAFQGTGNGKHFLAGRETHLYRITKAGRQFLKENK